MRSIVSLTARSFPGTGVAEKTTVSPECRLDVAVVVVGHPPQRRERLALAAGRDHDDLLVGEALDLARLDEEALRRFGDAQVRRDVEVLAHRAADQRHAPVELHRGVDHLLDTVDVGGEGGDDDPALAAGEGLQQSRPDARLRGRDSGPVGVGGVAAEQQQPVATDLGKPGDVGRAAVDGRLVELVVAGHQDRAELGREQDAAGVGDRVREVDQLQLEWPGLDLLPRREVLERRVAELVLVELRADHPDRQLAAVDHRGRAELAQNVGQGADVVLVPVGEDDRLDVVHPVAQVGEVGKDEVDPEHLGGREHQAGVDDDDAACVLDHGHVLADLAQPSERQHTKLVGGH